MGKQDHRASRDHAPSTCSATPKSAAPDRKIYWRCFHCGDAFTKAQEKHARAHFGAAEDALPICQMRLPGEYHLLNILRKQEAELSAFYAEDTELWRALHAQAADHAQALRSEEERGYARGVADVRREDANAILHLAIADASGVSDEGPGTTKTNPTPQTEASQ